MSWLKDILDDNRWVVESWPAWKRGAIMTRKEELELKAAQWLQHHGDQRLTQPLAALLEQVEREVLSRISARMAMVVESKETPCTSGSEPNNRS